MKTLSLDANAFEDTQNYLHEFILSPNFNNVIEKIFGTTANIQQARQFLQDLSEANVDAMPRLVICLSSAINNARGAYAAATDTIYLASEFLLQNKYHAEIISAVLLEEIGHALDARLNSTDTNGDEGELFSAAVRGQSLTTFEQQRISSEDDSATVMLGGKPTTLEQANSSLGLRQGYGYQDDSISYSDSFDNWEFSISDTGGLLDYVAISSDSIAVDLTLRLYDSYGNYLDSNTTGNYEFISLADVPAGTYTAQVFDAYGALYILGEAYYTLEINAPISSNHLPTGKVLISGETKQGQTLVVTNTLDDADGLGEISYQWLRNGKIISGATASDYTLTLADVGKIISVKASYTDDLGTLESKTSASTITIAAAPKNHPPTGDVVIDGTATEGQTLTVSDTLADSDGLGKITYQWWNADAVAIGSGKSYTLTKTDVGTTITVTASYTDLLGTTERVVSAATATIVASSNSAITVTAGGNPTTGENGDTVSYTVQLNTPVVRDIAIVFTSSDTSEGLIDKPTLKFNANNWQTPQTVTIRGIDDYEDDQSVAYSVTAKITTLDVNYARAVIKPIALSNLDDGRDTPQYLVGDFGGIPKKDIISGLDGPDRIYGGYETDDLYGGIGDDRLYGGYDDDILTGQEGNDQLFGEQDDDRLEGGAGNDSLDGGTGVDTLIGGAGNDTYYLGYEAKDVLDDQGLAGDVDTVIMPYNLTSYSLPKGIENGTIAEGEQASSLSGNAGNNTLTGNAGNNGLIGGAGKDKLNGDAGNDTLIGGTSNDLLTGGAGRDNFLFNATLSQNIDKITDFNSVSDTIQLENSIFTRLTKTGVLNASAFVIGNAAVDGTDKLIYNKTTGAIYYDDDGSGAHAAVQIATLGVKLTLTAADFVVV